MLAHRYSTATQFVANTHSTISAMVSQVHQLVSSCLFDLCRSRRRVSTLIVCASLDECNRFSLASEWAMVRYFRYQDRPELSGFSKISEQQEAELVERARRGRVEMLKRWAWDNRFPLIGTAWASSLAIVLSREMRNKHANSVAKFGHARIAAQGVTIAAVILAFAFNEETGPFADRYHKERDGSAQKGYWQPAEKTEAAATAAASSKAE
jgi:hypothetical protein